MLNTGLWRVQILGAALLALAVLGGCQRATVEDDNRNDAMAMNAAANGMNGGGACCGMPQRGAPGMSGGMVMGGEARAMMVRRDVLPIGVPPGAKLVGGGVRVEFAAPADGMIYIVDSETWTLLATRIMDADSDTLEKDLTLNTDLAEYRTLRGLPADAQLKNPHIVVYFATYQDLGLPAPATETQPADMEMDRPHP